MDGFNEANVWGDTSPSNQSLHDSTHGLSNVGSGSFPGSSKKRGGDGNENEAGTQNVNEVVDEENTQDMKSSPTEEQSIPEESQMEDVDFHTPERRNSGVDDFKIQNELAATMRSLTLDRNENEPGFEEYPVVKVSSLNELQPEVSSAAEKKKQLLSTLTSNSNDELGFLDESKKVDLTVPASGESLFEGQNDRKGPLDVIDMATDTYKNPTNTGDVIGGTKQSTGSLSSPNRKTLLLRPRRIKSRRKIGISSKNSEMGKKDASIDPLAAVHLNGSPLKGSDSNGGVPGADLSPDARNEKIIASLDKPLFNVDKISDGVGLSTSNESSTEQKVAKQSVSSPEPFVAKFDITVGDPTKIGELTSTHIVYTITTRTSSDILTEPVTEVTRRYKDFLWLYRQMLNNHPGYIVPPPPEKQIYGRFDEKFIESRRIALETMLNKIAGRAVFQRDPEFIVFLQSKQFTEDSRDRDQAIHHGREASLEGDISNGNSGDDESLGSGNATSSATPMSMADVITMGETSTSTAGFFSSLIGLNVPKYVETDPFMLEKQSYVENLDRQLHSLSKSLDYLLEKREELIASKGEVVKLVSNLSDIEINSDVTELFSNFEELQSKIQQLLERTNLSQIMTIGATIDEYIRAIGSIRNCFENRFKLCNSLVNVQYQQEKKAKQLGKLKAKYQNQTEKITKCQRELDRLDRAVQTQTEFRDKYNDRFRKELERFDLEKVKEFKNIIEIYWKGLVESQKELIELWESFYEKCDFDKSDSEKDD